MDIDEAKVILKEFNKEYEEENGTGDLAEGIAEMVVDWNDNEAIETILNELEKKDKIIDLMAEELADWYMDNRINNRKIDKQYVINKFTNKVEEDKDNG